MTKTRAELVPMMVNTEDCDMLLEWAKGRKGVQAEILRELLRLTRERAERRAARHGRAAA